MDIGWPLRTRSAWLIAGLAAFVALIALGPGSRPALALTNCTVTSSIDSEEQAFLGLINSYRRDNGKSPLSLSTSLNRSAAWKAQHMADNDYFAHNDDPINRTWVQRIRDCGYSANTYIGENLAAGNESASGAFNQWKNSPAHNENMLNGDYVVIGIGRAHSAGSTYGWYWATDFGGQSETAPPPPSNGVHNGDVDCNNRTDPVDASLVLQRSAGVTANLPCQSDADVNEDGAITPIDAVLILQFSAGMVASLPV